MTGMSPRRSTLEGLPGLAGGDRDGFLRGWETLLARVRIDFGRGMVGPQEEQGGRDTFPK